MKILRRRHRAEDSGLDAVAEGQNGQVDPEGDSPRAGDGADDIAGDASVAADRSGPGAQQIVRPVEMDAGMRTVLNGKLTGAPDGCPVGSCALCGEPAVASGDGFRFRHAHLAHLAAPGPGGRRFEVVPGSQYCDPHNLASGAMKSGKDVRDPQLVGFERGTVGSLTSPGLRWVRDLCAGDDVVWGNRIETLADIELALGSLRLRFVSGKVAEFAIDAHDVIYRVPTPGEVTALDEQWRNDGAWETLATPLVPGRDHWSGSRFLGSFVAKTLLHKCVYADDVDVLKRLVATEDFGTVWDVSSQRVLHWNW